MRATLYHPARHLEATQLIAAESHCPICGSAGGRTAVGVIQRDPLISLLSCPCCGGCSASHLPRPEVLATYYQRYYQGYSGPKIAIADASGFARRLQREVQLNCATRDVRILDFGGGDGTLGLAVARQILAADKNRSVHFTLVDFQSPAQTEAFKRLTVTHRDTLDAVAGTFDVVLASAILEHIPDLAGTMRRLLALLAPGGWFYARTPYLAPLKRVLPNLDLTYPGHVHDLGAPFWNCVAETFQVPLCIVVSRPSLIETSFVRQPLRTTAAWMLKAPARLELALRRTPRTPWWRWVGGWEVILQKVVAAITTAAPTKDTSPARLQTAASLRHP